MRASLPVPQQSAFPGQFLQLSPAQVSVTPHPPAPPWPNQQWMMLNRMGIPQAATAPANVRELITLHLA